MFAIALTEENLPKIVDLQKTPEELRMLDVYLALKSNWYVVSGYVSPSGALEPSIICQPAYLFPTNFEYDPIKIKTDWDQIVRK